MRGEEEMSEAQCAALVVAPLPGNPVQPMHSHAPITHACTIVRTQVKSLSPCPELLVVSPLTRALETASLAFLPHYPEGHPVLVEPLVRERVWL